AVRLAVTGLPTGLADKKDEDNIPKHFALSQNYPNPFNPATHITYTLPRSNFVTLTIYNLIGKEVQTLVQEFQPSGSYSVNFNAAHLSSGVYFYRLETGGLVQTNKMILLQ
ncbi:T9SS type A sorting domain-containing protein, partial [candidate division KSB1 bacterium]|nr:T9SS type A sorting domain-containing protein [candidate division KSB1 bacterium]